MRLIIAFVTIVALMAIALMPVDMALGQQANPGRTLPDTVERGETFDVTVTFAAPADKFNAIGLTDLAPAGWNVTVDKVWSNPSAEFVKATGNKAELLWFGEQGVGFYSGTSFSVVYRVAVPDYACAGKHTFDGFLEYYVATEGPYIETITGDSEVEVPVADTPLICCNPKRLTFNATEGGSNPASQTLEISNSGIDTIDWVLSDDAPWLSESPTSGSSTGEHDTVAVSVDIAGMSAGDYSASISITADGAINSPWAIPVSLHISSAAPQISFSPESLSFTAVEGSSNPSNGVLEIWNSGVDTLNWSLSDDAAWLGEDPTNSSSTGEHDTVAVSVDIAGMSAGDYSASITITAEASNSPQVVPVNLHISSAAPQISFKPGRFSFAAVEGGPTHAAETLEIWNSGVDTLHWSLSDDAAWLSEDPTSGSSTGEHDTVVVSVDIAGMSVGDYSTNITITAEASNSLQVVPVSLHISSAAPQISFMPESVIFTAVGAGPTPPNKTLGIWNSGIGILNWSVSDDAAWLSENPTSGSSMSPHDTTSVAVSVDTSGMSDGDYSANITITAPGASNSPQTVLVSLHVGEIGPPSPPSQPWLSRYWWTIVVGVVAVVLLAYFLRRKRAAY
jgi:hypothetical protein